MKAKHNGKEVRIKYVSGDRLWALVTADLKEGNYKYKVDVIELEDYDKFQLEEVANRKKGV